MTAEISDRWGYPSIPASLAADTEVLRAALVRDASLDGYTVPADAQPVIVQDDDFLTGRTNYSASIAIDKVQP